MELYGSPSKPVQYLELLLLIIFLTWSAKWFSTTNEQVLQYFLHSIALSKSIVLGARRDRKVREAVAVHPACLLFLCGLMLGYRVKRWVVIFIEHPGMCVRYFTHTLHPHN